MSSGESDLFDKGDKEYAQCWCAARNRVGKHWRNETKKCSRKSTVTTEIKNSITSLPIWIELRQADSFEHWLVMYLLIFFRSFLTPKSYEQKKKILVNSNTI